MYDRGTPYHRITTEVYNSIFHNNSLGANMEHVELGNKITTLFGDQDVSNMRVLRPSSIDTFYGCAYQWYQRYVLGAQTIPSLRANIGTAIHKGAETMWREAIATNNKDINISAMVDASMEEFKEVQLRDKAKDPKLTNADAELLVRNGTTTYATDIATVVDIPLAVEVRVSMPVTNSYFDAVSGTIDYLGVGTIADTKTSAKTITTASSYLTQQSVYTVMAEQVMPIHRNEIHGVALTKKPTGNIVSFTANRERANYLINTIMNTMDIYTKDVVSPEVLFRGNPKYMFCSHAYCNLYATCPFVQSKAPTLGVAPLDMEDLL